MNNSDFARLLTTNDKELVKELTSSKKKTGAAAEKRKERALLFKGKGKGGDGDGKGKGKGGKGKGTETAEAKPTGPVYRDRATERRELTGEYEQIAAEWENHAEVQMDDSKYLGGDLDHTHLVKGLDFSLLAKVRNEQAKKQKHEELHKERKDRKAGVKKERSFEAPIAKNIWRAVVETLHPHHTTFKQRMQNMARALAKGQRIRGAPSVFLPGRMHYEFDTGLAQGSTDIPRIIYMSKEDAPKADFSKKAAPVLSETVANVKNAFARAAEERRQRKLAAKTTSAEGTSQLVAQKVGMTAKHKAKDADNDIFGDVGSFDPAAFNAKEKEKADKEKAAKSAASKDKAPSERGASYFDDAGALKYRKGASEQLELDNILVDESDTVGLDVTDDSAPDNFKPSTTFSGAKPGWAFKLGVQGLGYYRDPKSDGPLPSEKKSKSQKPAKKSTARESAPGFNAPPAETDDAYGECFPESGLTQAMVVTGDDGESDDEDGKKKEKGKGKGKGKDKDDALKTSQFGKKGAAQEAKKKRMTQDQEWNKIDNMIKKGKVGNLEDLERHASKRTPAPGGSARQSSFPTPAFF